MQALQTKSNIGEMFNIQEKENGEIAISARELYKALEVKKRFSAWAEINLKHFKENRDFTSVLTSTVVNNGAVRQLEDYALTLNHNHDERYVLSSQAFTKQQADNLYQLKSASQPTVKIWTGTENEYNYIYQKDPNTLYLIKG